MKHTYAACFGRRKYKMAWPLGTFCMALVAKVFASLWRWSWSDCPDSFTNVDQFCQLDNIAMEPPRKLRLFYTSWFLAPKSSSTYSCIASRVVYYRLGGLAGLAWAKAAVVVPVQSRERSCPTAGALSLSLSWRGHSLCLAHTPTLPSSPWYYTLNNAANCM